MSEARVDHVEERLARIEGAIIRIEERLEATLPHLATKADLARIEATLPHLGTKAELADVRAELADKPSRLYMWGVMAAMTGAYTAALAAVGVLLTYLPHH